MTSSIKYDRPVPNWALPIARIIFICAIIVLTYNSVRPATASIGIANFDKVLHACAYFVLAGLFGLAMPKLRLAYVALLPCLYGGVLEAAQGTMSAGRTASFYDMLANIFGAVIAVLLWWVIANLLSKRSG